MAIRWMKNVIIDNAKSTIEIQLGDRKLGDKCYTRINNEIEQWFDNFRTRATTSSPKASTSLSSGWKAKP